MADDFGSCAELEPFALQVLGDSMEPEFPDQCIVVIEPTSQPRHGMYVMALVEGVRWFRQYLNDADGERLVALNDLYPQIELAGLDWKVEGMIVQRNLPRDRARGIRRNVKRYQYD
jgi:SOS-response transcriptional repressor LexA